MKFSASILLTLFVLLAPLSVQATSYAMPTFEDAYASADFVLYGNILSVADPYEEATYEACGNKVYAQRGKIQIKKHWKMELDEENVLSPGTHLVNPDMGACDVSFPLAEGKEIIIFGNLDDEGRLTTYGGSLNVYEDSTYFSDAIDFLNKKVIAAAIPTVDVNPTPAPEVETPIVVQEVIPEDIETGDETPMETLTSESENQTESESDVGVVGSADATTSNGEVAVSIAAPSPTPSRGIVEQIVDFIRGLFGFK